MLISYEASYKDAWDEFVISNSINGNFLQTRRFLEYHPEGKFIDNSILFKDNKNKIQAVLPMNAEKENGILISHRGSTFGGLVIGADAVNITTLDWIFDELLSYFRETEFQELILRMPSYLYYRTNKNAEILDYYFERYGFHENREVGYFVDLKDVDEEFEKYYAKLKKRKLKKAFSNDLSFQKLTTDREVEIFYKLLENNMTKFHTVPVHTLDQLLDFKNARLKDTCFFYGVFHEGDMVAGSMVFNFCSKKTFHTQYLASSYEHIELCPNEYLYHMLIQEAKKEGYRYLSFGTTTLGHGKVFNKNLALFKEGFHTDTYVNPTFLLSRDTVREAIKNE